MTYMKDCYNPYFAVNLYLSISSIALSNGIASSPDVFPHMFLDKQ